MKARAIEWTDWQAFPDGMLKEGDKSNGRYIVIQHNGRFEPFWGVTSLSRGKMLDEYEDAIAACQAHKQRQLDATERVLFGLAEPAPIADIGPITPEALEAAGWKPKLELKSLKEFRHNRIITIRFWDHGKVDILLEAALCPLPIPNCKTMEQLHQLLEMMGVGQ